MSRRGYPDLPDYSDNFGVIQARRRGYSDSKQALPLHIKIPPTTSLCELNGRFENPRKAPLPQGLKYNTLQNGDSPQFDNVCSPTMGSRSLGIPLTMDNTDLHSEFSDLSQVSIFSLPRFDPEKEIRTLQNLWSKRNSTSICPFIFRPESPEDTIDQKSDSSIERSFFESDSDTDDEELISKRLRHILR
jgi:hypothetical protein